MTDEAKAVVKKLQAAGHEAFFIGGCVRDLLLARGIKDVDIATSARPTQVMKLFPDNKPVGAAFGVVLVQESGETFEVATFRADGAYHDGRRPTTVAYSDTLREDVMRRDFTINGMAYDPIRQKMIDLIDGLADLTDKTIRAIGNPVERFQEDHLRMLRAVRFATVLRFNIEPDTLEAIRANAGLIVRVSCERIQMELEKMLGYDAGLALDWLDRSGLLPYIFPEVAVLKGVEQPPEYHPEGDVWVHTSQMMHGLAAHSSFELAMGVLLHDIGKFHTQASEAGRITFRNHAAVGAAQAKEICRRLGCSNKTTDHIVSLVENHMIWHGAKHMKDSTVKRYLRLERFADHLELHRLDCINSNGDLSNHAFLTAKQKEFGLDKIRPARLLNGHEIIAMGYNPGPKIGAILEALETAQLDGLVRSKEEAVMFVQNNF